MSGRRYLQINDPHMSDQAPRMRTDSYGNDILSKLSVVMQMADNLGVDGVVITGDLFHRKQANHTSHRTVQWMREILNGPMTPVYIVPGNHDEAHGGGLSGQPLLSLVGDYVCLLYGDDPDDPYICGVPWDTAFEREQGAVAFASAVNACRAPLVFAHAPLTPRPYPFGPEAQGWIEIAAVAGLLRPSARVIAHGHMHSGHDLTYLLGAPDAATASMAWPGGRPVDAYAVAPHNERGATLWSNPGALARATIGADDIDRAPQVALISYEDEGDGPERWTAEYLPVQHRPAAEVFRIEVHEAATGRDAGITALARSFASASTNVATADVLCDTIRALPAPEGIEADDWAAAQQVAIEAIERADAKAGR